ncbi:hypothetical protein [Candidatus Bandiella euplotis]|uniref:Outer membrane protein beta-barrel domain-containing protein n=1 Tax=Candidatus Bandiella euplotis TaxID=1664265 RepID=A0ABZ0URQ3_9RICK|nr:hypothetical protein [Candidatus Bandiella woodruffii]WPX97408.1 hypothetical protein Bandiella_01560 [Candidatus Bandiella woodruffii]
MRHYIYALFMILINYQAAKASMRDIDLTYEFNFNNKTSLQEINKIRAKNKYELTAGKNVTEAALKIPINNKYWLSISAGRNFSSRHYSTTSDIDIAEYFPSHYISKKYKVLAYYTMCIVSNITKKENPWILNDHYILTKPICDMAVDRYIFADRLKRYNKGSKLLTTTQSFVSYIADYRLGLDLEIPIAKILVTNKLYQVQFNPYVLIGSSISYSIESVYKVDQKRELVNKEKRYGLGIKYGLGVEFPVNENTSIDLKLCRFNTKGGAIANLMAGISFSY